MKNMTQTSERILIVDADELLRDSLMLALASEGPEIVALENGDDALAWLDRNPTDLVFCGPHVACRNGQSLIVTLAARCSVIAVSAEPGLVDLAISESDHISRNFLQWFVNEQLEEVSSMDQLLSIVRRAGESGLLFVEDYLARRGAPTVASASAGAGE